MNIRTKSAERFVGNCIWIKSEVLEEDEAVATLRAGSTYGHSLTMANEALWTLDVRANSSVSDQRQIAYVRTRDPRTWRCRVTLPPNREVPSVEILACQERTTGRDAIRTKVDTNNNLSDELLLDLEIK
jgi:hypothetical protein